MSSIAEDTKELTIKVEAGVYNGDITISLPTTASADGGEDEENAESASPWTDFVLNIVSSDAYTAKTESESETYSAGSSGGDVKVNGNIIVDGINVLLAGIYLSMEKRIEVQNASLSVIGTTEDDTVNIKAGDGVDSIDVQTGEGGDTVNIRGDEVGTIGVDTGEDDDTVNVRVGVESDVTIETGDGDDSVNAMLVPGEEPSAETSVTVDTGEGEDRIGVDIGIADAVTEITIADPDRYSVNFSGELSADDEEPITVSEDKTTYTFINSNENSLAVHMDNIIGRSVTDSIGNKNEVAIDWTSVEIITDAQGRQIAVCLFYQLCAEGFPGGL